MLTLDVANNLASIVISVILTLGILIGFVAWFIRLESKVQYLEQDHQSHREDASQKDKAMWEKIDSLQIAMNQVLIALGELKGEMRAQ